VRNRFQVLAEHEDPSVRYRRFVDANRKATEQWVPKKEHNKKVPYSKYPEVIKATENMQETCKRHITTGSEEDRELLKEAKEMLFNA